MSIKGENGGVSQTKRPFVFAYYVTGHGFGHATRVVEVSLAIQFLFCFYAVLTLMVDLSV